MTKARSASLNADRFERLLGPNVGVTRCTGATLEGRPVRKDTADLYRLLGT